MNGLGHAYPFLETPQFTRREGVGFTDNRDNVYTRGQTAHELNVHLPKASMMFRNCKSDSWKKLTHGQSAG